jgi:hypothetical protein
MAWLLPFMNTFAVIPNGIYQTIHPGASRVADSSSFWRWRVSYAAACVRELLDPT